LHFLLKSAHPSSQRVSARRLQIRRLSDHSLLLASAAPAGLLQRRGFWDLPARALPLAQPAAAATPQWPGRQQLRDRTSGGDTAGGHLKQPASLGGSPQMSLVSSCLCFDEHETPSARAPETRPGATCPHRTKERCAYGGMDRTRAQTRSTSPQNPNYAWNRLLDPQ